MNRSVFIGVQGWDYMLEETDKGIHLFRHGSREDGGYNGDVSKYLPEGYFSNHDAAAFYEYVSGLAACRWPGDSEEAEKERLELKSILKNEGYTA